MTAADAAAGAAAARAEPTRKARLLTCDAASSPRAAGIASVVRCVERTPAGLLDRPRCVSSTARLHCTSSRIVLLDAARVAAAHRRISGGCQAATVLTTVKGRSCDRPDALGRRYVTAGAHGTGAASGGARGCHRPSSRRRCARGGVAVTNVAPADTVACFLAPRSSGMFGARTKAFRARTRVTRARA